MLIWHVLAARGGRCTPEVGYAVAGETAEGYCARLPRWFHTVHQDGWDRRKNRVRHLKPRPEGKDASDRLSPPGRQGLAPRSRDGDSVQGDPAGEHGQRETGEID